MEEFAVAEDGNLILRQNDIRPAAQFVIVLPVPVSFGPQCLSQLDFYLGVLPFDMLHRFPSLLLAENIHFSTPNSALE